MILDGLHFVREGNGPPLLWCVGLGGRCEFWKPQIARFRDRFDCISFDHRKTGDSLPSDVTTTVRELAEDAVRLLDSLRIECAHVVGHSLGGAIAQHLAVFHPERIKQLAISASWAGPTPLFLQLFALRRMVLETLGPREYMLQGALLGNPGWWLAPRLDEVLAGIEARLASFAGVEVELERMAAVTSHDLRDRVETIAAPTLVVCARDDQITPLPLSEELAALIPGSRLEVLPAGNHFAPATVPDDFAAVLERFLAPAMVAAA